MCVWGGKAAAKDHDRGEVGGRRLFTCLSGWMDHGANEGGGGRLLIVGRVLGWWSRGVSGKDGWIMIVEAALS